MSERERRKIVGYRLMILRGDRTQKEVAEAIGISPGRLRHYESGRCSTKDPLKKPLADYYKVNVLALFFTFDKPFVFPEKDPVEPEN